MNLKYIITHLYKIRIWIILFSLFFLPLIYLDSVYLKYELPKIIVFRILVSLSFLLFLVEILFKRAGLIFYDFLKKRKFVFFILVLLLSWSIFTVLYSGNMITAIFGNYYKRFGLYTVLHLALFGFLLFDIKKYSDYFWKNFELVLPIPLIISFIVSFFQIVYETIPFEYTDGRAVGTFGQSNFLSIYALALIPFSVFFIYKYFKFKNFLPASYQVLGFLSLLLVLYFTDSRIGWLILIIQFLFFGIFLLTKIGNYPKTKYIFTLFGLGIGFFLFLITQNSRFQNFGFVDPTRELIWQSSIDLIYDNPIKGVGFDVSGFLLPTYMYQNGDTTVPALDRSHNSILDIIHNIGLIGLVVLLIFIGYILVRFLRNYFSEKSIEKRFLKFIFLISFLSLVIRSMVGVNGMVQQIWIVFLLAFMFFDSFDTKKEKLIQTQIDFLKLSYTNFFALIVIIFLVVFNVFLNLGELKADIYYRNFLGSRGSSLDTIAETVKFAPFQERYRIELLQVKIDKDLEVEIDEVIPQYFVKQKEHSAEYYFRMGNYYRIIDNDVLASKYFEIAKKKNPSNFSYKEL